MNISGQSPSLPSTQSTRAANLTKAISDASSRSFEVTVSDRGIDVKDVAASRPVTAAREASPPTTVTSTPQLQQTLSMQETEALTERFADLPRTSSAGLYGRAGRQAVLPLAAHQGQLLDITG